jgi:hypothetical protein
MKLLIMQFFLVSSYFLVLDPYIFISTSAGALKSVQETSFYSLITYKTTGKIRAPCILVFEFLLDERQEDKELFCDDR